MLEKAFVGGRKYWTWMACLLGIMGLGFIMWLWQFRVGLGITGMSRDVYHRHRLLRPSEAVPSQDE